LKYIFADLFSTIEKRLKDTTPSKTYRVSCGSASDSTHFYQDEGVIF